ncbi:hypothetical protein C2G38_2217415 [Gigaspora rosea]|uniref:Uncharacterized protein n=1 Tax=Gigaspora rosea TaxID=44941 RepID=A0A397U822_9GLOM|nr:hypothetical protein C2G38_2217415 [Gigaspora rosea]
MEKEMLTLYFSLVFSKFSPPFKICSAFTELFGVPLVPVNCTAPLIPLRLASRTHNEAPNSTDFPQRQNEDARKRDSKNETPRTTTPRMTTPKTMTPTVGCYVLITEKLPNSVKSTDFPSANKIKKLDLDGFNCRISQFGTQDLTLFGNYPLFLVKDDIIDVLKKLGVPFTEESPIDARKKFIYELLFDLRLHDIERDIPDKKQRTVAIAELEGKFLRWREQNSLKDMPPPIYYD